MIAQKWRNGFASGLIIGILFFTLAIVALDTMSPDKSSGDPKYSDSENSTDHNASNRQPIVDRLYWLRRAFALEDSLAQWIMTFFTIVAAWLLLGTLKATREMVTDAKDAARNQLRPWVLYHENEISDGNGKPYNTPTARLKWKNFGNSPAIETQMVAGCKVVARSAPYDAFAYDHLSHGVAIAQGAVRHSPPIPLFHDCLEGFNRGELDWIIFGRVEYRHSLNPSKNSFDEIVIRVRREGNKSSETKDLEEPNYIKILERSISGDI